MKNPIDSVIDSVENESNDGKRERGARDRYYMCASLNGNIVTFEAVKAVSADEAKEAFAHKHGVKTIICDTGEGNGYYIAKGSGMSDAQRISVTVTAEQLNRRTGDGYKGQFKGWHVFASGLRGCKIGDHDYKDNDLVSVEFESLVTGLNKKDNPKPKLKKREVVRLVDVQNAQLMAEQIVAS